MNDLYSAYGLCIQSHWELPPLLRGSGSPDVIVREASADEFPRRVIAQPGWHVPSSDAIYLHAGALGQFGARAGNELVALPAPTLDATTLTNFLITTALNLILFQRGYLLLHASVVAIDGAAVAFLGGSGWGKSTLAAALEARGHRVIADDTLALDLSDPTTPRALPAFPQMKLYPDSLELVGVAADGLPRVQTLHVNGAGDKRFRSLADQFVDGGAPLKRLYVLERRDHAEIARLSRGAAFPELMQHSFVGKLAAAFGVDLLAVNGRALTHLRQCTTLLDAVPVARLYRPWDLGALGGAAALVERDIAGL